MDQQQYCLRWNNHGSTLVAVFDNLLARESLVDVTLFAEGHLLKAHKVVLSACSAYFERLFSETQDRHPIVVLKDVGHQELRALLEYMYRGEVNVVQDQLEPLIRTAESLRIKGLADGQRGAQGPGTSRPDPDAAMGGSPLGGAGQGTTPTPTPISGPSLPQSQSQSTPSMIKSEASCPMEPRGMGVGVSDARVPLECRSGFQVPPPSSVPSVLSTVLTMPPALSLAAAAAAAATPLTSKLKAEGITPTPTPTLDTCPSSPLAKRRRKTRHRSGDTLERDSGGDSDGQSSTSPGDPLHQLPRIPATITPVPTTTSGHYQPSQRDETRRDETRRDDDRGERGERGGGTSFMGGSSFSGGVSSFGMGGSSLLMGGNSLGVGGSSYGEGGGSSSPSPDSLGGSTRGDSAPTPNSLLPRPLSAHEHSSPGLFKPFHARHDDNSSDANHQSDDDQEASRGAAHDLTTDSAGPSTSRLPQDDQPHTPGYLGWPYPQDPPTSSEDSAFPSLENTNQGLLLCEGWLATGLWGGGRGRGGGGGGGGGNNNETSTGGGGGGGATHSCPKCGRSYTLRSNLSRHMRLECGVERRYRCAFCHKRFSHAHHLRSHERSIHAHPTPTPTAPPPPPPTPTQTS